MLEFVEGMIEEISTHGLVINYQGMGLKIIMAKHNLEASNMARIYVYTNHQEDKHELYGFMDKADKLYFMKLIKIKGIGCQSAMKILNVYHAQDLEHIIMLQQVDALVAIKGISKIMATKIMQNLSTTGQYQEIYEILLPLQIKPNIINEYLANNDVSNMCIEEIVNNIIKKDSQ